MRSRSAFIDINASSGAVCSVSRGARACERSLSIVANFRHIITCICSSGALIDVHTDSTCVSFVPIRTWASERADCICACFSCISASVKPSSAFIYIDAGSRAVSGVAIDAGAEVASLSIVAIFNSTAWTGNALVDIYAVAISISFIAAVTDWKTDGANSLGSRIAWWVDTKSHTLSLGSSTVWIVHHDAMRMFSLACLCGCWEPRASGFSIAVEGCTSHSCRTTELVSGNIGERIATNRVGGGPFNNDFEAWYPNPNSFFALCRRFSTKRRFAEAVIWLS